MLRRPPSSTRTDPLFPYTPLFRSVSLAALAAGGPASDHHIGSGARARERPPCSIRCASPPEVPVSGGQRRIVDDEAVFHVAALHPVVRIVDLFDADHLAVTNDPVPGADIEPSLQI